MYSRIKKQRSVDKADERVDGCQFWFGQKTLLTHRTVPCVISEIDTANDIYAQIEKTRAENKIDAVLVHAESFIDLKKAYPNYFADIGEFIERVSGYLK